MKFVAKVETYHNTKGLIAEGQEVEFDTEEIKEYDPQYFKDLFEFDGDIDEVVAPTTEETEEVADEVVALTTRGRKAKEK